MTILNYVIFQAYRPYFSIIKKTINETDSDFDLSCLHPKVIDIANNGSFNENDITISLHALSVFLNARYEVPCIVFIDEYDAPYDTAYQYGYYEEAQPIIGQLLTLLLKVLLSHT
jgi:hypothetical protein